MASLNGAYDPDASLPSDREPIPAGNYPIELTESDIVPTKNGKGQLFKYTTQVSDGEQKGRLVYGQMNLQNENPQAQEIGQSEFAALRTLTGVMSPDDTQDFHYKQFTAVVIIEPAKGEYKAKNAIHWGKSIKLANGEEQPPVGKEQEKTLPKAANDNKPAPASAGKKTPWQKKAA